MNISWFYSIPPCYNWWIITQDNISSKELPHNRVSYMRKGILGKTTDMPMIRSLLDWQTIFVALYSLRVVIKTENTLIRRLPKGLGVVHCFDTTNMREFSWTKLFAIGEWFSVNQYCSLEIWFGFIVPSL